MNHKYYGWEDKILHIFSATPSYARLQIMEANFKYFIKFSIIFQYELFCSFQIRNLHFGGLNPVTAALKDLRYPKSSTI